MRFFWGALVLATAISSLYAADEDYRPLWLYQGHWKGTMKNDAGESQVDIVNDCGRIGRFFGCQQTVNAKPGALVLYVPAGSPGHYYTQAVLQEGLATGRGELTIEGEHWTFQGKSEDKGITTYHKTTNTFAGKNRIHFELLDSTDGEHWTLTGSGDETRASKISK